MKERLREFLFVFINVSLALSMGLIFYIERRSNSYVTKFLLQSNYSIPNYLNIDIFIYFPFENHFADFMWAYALSMLMALVTDIKKALTISIIFEVILESLQLIPALHQTFDFLDILCEIVATIIATLLFTLMRRFRDEKQQNLKDNQCISDSGSIRGDEHCK